MKTDEYEKFVVWAEFIDDNIDGFLNNPHNITDNKVVLIVNGTKENDDILFFSSGKHLMDHLYKNRKILDHKCELYLAYPELKNEEIKYEGYHLGNMQTLINKYFAQPKIPSVSRISFENEPKKGKGLSM